MCLADGDVPAEGRIRGLEQFIALSPPDRGFGRLTRRHASLGKRLRLLLSSERVRPGDLMRRKLLLQGGGRLARPIRMSAAVERDPSLG